MSRHFAAQNVARRTLALCAMLCAVTCAALAQAVPHWLETKHDFGTIREHDGRVACVMRVVNVGDSALVLVRTRTTCGCTAVDITRDAIAPGDTGRVTIAYSPKNRPGEFEKEVTVYSNGVPSRSTLTIVGNVIPEASTLDDQYPVAVGALRLSGTMLPVGEVTRPRTRNAYLSGYNASTDTLVVSTLHTPEHIVARAVPDTVPPGAVVSLIVTIYSDKAPLWGLNDDTFDVLAEPLHDGNGAISGMTRIEVIANVRESFATMSDADYAKAPVARLSCGERLNFARTSRGARATQQFTITNAGHSPLLLRRLWSGDKAVTAVADNDTLKPGKHATVTVTVDTAQLGGDIINTLLSVMTNDPQQPTQLIRLVGELGE